MTAALTTASDEPAIAEDDEEEEALFEQYVTFFIDKECFAFPMEAVLEIIRAPTTVDVPLTSPGLVGLANLRGAVLPVVDLRITLGLEPRPFDDATRAVVVNCGRPIALVVDRVSSVLDVEPEKVERSETASTLTHADLLTGVVKGVDGQELIQLLDVEKTVEEEFAAVAAGADLTKMKAAALDAAAPEDEEDADEDDGSIELVSLLVADQEYGFEISEIDEIVRVPSTISEVPHAASYAVGLITLRNRLLPLVSLRRIFDLPDQELTEHHRILVLRFPGKSGQNERIGVVVDRVLEVQRVGTELRAPMPGILRGDAEQIGSVCKLDSGSRLVGVLSVETLIDHPAIREAIEIRRQEVGDDFEEEPVDQDLEEDMFDEDDDDDDQLVVYQLADQEYGVQITAVQEIIRVPDTLQKVPKTPDFIEGMINLRGAVLPVAQMRARFEMEPLPRNDRQRILVLNVNDARMGFIVDSVSEVLPVPEGAIEQSPELSEEQSRLVGHVANLEGGARMIQVLDADALLASHEMESLKAAQGAADADEEAA